MKARQGLPNAISSERRSGNGDSKREWLAMTPIAVLKDILADWSYAELSLA